jgi:hypothetical protein
VKKFILLMIILLLAGCDSLEEKVSVYTEKQIEEAYGEKVKMTSIKESTPVGSTIIVVLVKLFGDGYDVEFESEDHPNFTFSGDISGNLENFDENFIQSKHEYFLETDKEYKKYNKVFLENGIEDVHMKSKRHKGKTYIKVYGIYNGGGSNPEKLVNTLEKIGSNLVNVPIEISLDLKMGYDNLITDYYGKNESNDFVQVLEQQFMLFHHNDIVDTEELDQELEPLNMFVGSILELEVDNDYFYTRLYKHQTLALHIRPQSSGGEIIKAFEVFKNHGMDESIVEIFNLEGQCKVKEVKVTEDLNRCYPGL